MAKTLQLIKRHQGKIKINSIKIILSGLTGIIQLEIAAEVEIEEVEIAKTKTYQLETHTMEIVMMVLWSSRKYRSQSHKDIDLNK